MFTREELQIIAQGLLELPGKRMIAVFAKVSTLINEMDKPQVKDEIKEPVKNDGPTTE